MSTDKQIEAPRTEEGRNQSRLNAIKHGLAGHLDVVTGAVRETRDAFIADIVNTFKPADALERQLAHSIADGYWRINRVSAIETCLHRKVNSDLRQLREIQSARRAAEAKQAEQEAAAERRTFDEACTLLELQLRQDDQLDLDGDFTHPNGFVYSIPKPLHAMAGNRRLQRARQCVATDPFTAAQLGRMLPVAS